MIPKAILVLRLSALGDIIHTAPAVTALRAAYPDTRIGWLVEAPYREFVRLIAPVDDVFTVATRRWRRDPFGSATRTEIALLGRDLQRFAWGQVSIDFQGLMKSAAFAMISGARLRWGFSFAAVREKPARLLCNRSVDVDQSLHVIEWNMGLARAAGAASSDVRFDFSRLPEDPAGELASLMASRPVILVPGAGRDDKRWSEASFRELAGRVRAASGRAPVVVWGPGEEPIAHAIAGGGDAVVAPPTSIRELAFVLHGASAVVAGDTGPLHLAAALDAPVVGLFGPTNPARNGPWGQLDNCVETWSGTKRMDSINVAQVMDRISAILARQA